MTELRSGQGRNCIVAEMLGYFEVRVVVVDYLVSIGGLNNDSSGKSDKSQQISSFPGQGKHTKCAYRTR